MSLLCILSAAFGFSRLKSSLHGESESVGDVGRVGLTEAAIADKMSRRADWGRGLRTRAVMVEGFCRIYERHAFDHYLLSRKRQGGVSCDTYISCHPTCYIDRYTGRTDHAATTLPSTMHTPRRLIPEDQATSRCNRIMAAYQDFSPNFITRTRRVLQDNGARAGNLHGLTRLEDMNRSEPSRCRAGSTNTSFFHAGICHVPVTGAISLPRSLYGRIGLTAVKPVMRGLDFLN